MKVANNDSGFVLCNNPVRLSSNMLPGEDSLTGVVKIFQGESLSECFTLRFAPPLDIDISEILDSIIPKYPDIVSSDNYITQLYDYDELKQTNRFRIYADCGNYDDECEFIALPGGVSNQALRNLCNLNTNVFNARFLNYNGNFFLTNKGDLNEVILKETEIYPLFFLNDKPREIAFFDPVSSEIVSEKIYYGIYTVDLNMLRRLFLKSYGAIPSLIKVTIDGRNACRIIIEKSENAKDRYRVKYRNSFGVFELIELSGEVYLNHENDDSDVELYTTYDKISDDYITQRPRINGNVALSLNTGFKRENDIKTLFEMIRSDEVYLLDVCNQPLQVIPSIDETSFKHKLKAPFEFNVHFVLSDSHTDLLSTLNEYASSSKSRIFSSQFDKTFN